MLRTIVLYCVESENGDTAMHIAACQNNENMISFLLDMGANPNVLNQQGQTPVMKAAEYGHVQSLQILAEAGSDMTGTIDTMLLLHHTIYRYIGLTQ